MFMRMAVRYLLLSLPLNDLWLGKMSSVMYGARGHGPGGALVCFHFFCFPSIKGWGHAYQYACEAWKAISGQREEEQSWERVVELT